MHDALGMRGVQRIGDLDRDLQQLIGLQRFSGDALPQRLAFQQLHGDEGPLLVFANVVNDADVGVIQSRGGARFALEPL